MRTRQGAPPTVNVRAREEADEVHPSQRARPRSREPLRAQCRPPAFDLASKIAEAAATRGLA